MTKIESPANKYIDTYIHNYVRPFRDFITNKPYYPRINSGETVNIDKTLIVISIPKECDYIVPQTGERKAFKFVSKIFPLPIQE